MPCHQSHQPFCAHNAKEKEKEKMWQQQRCWMQRVGKMWNLISYFLCAHDAMNHMVNVEMLTLKVPANKPYRGILCIYLYFCSLSPIWEACMCHIHTSVCVCVSPYRAITCWIILRRRYPFPSVLYHFFTFATIFY